jgi:4-diphosphocytidyl-2-C-methyl-D-erythritol kinase
MERSCTVRVPAKINLSLDVVGVRPDGYHLLETVMQTIGLFDTIHITVSYGDATDAYPEIRIFCADPKVPTDERNTVYKAAVLFLQQLSSGRNPQHPPIGRQVDDPIVRVDITIHKGIPQEAGLAGGSADAAGTLAGLSELTGNVLTMSDRMDLAAKTGADVPFCLTGGTALCTGIGEVVTPLKDYAGRHLVLIKPDFGVSTPWAFRELDRIGGAGGPDTEAVVAALTLGQDAALFRVASNVLESVVIPAHPMIGEMKKALLAQGGCIGAMMSGSGAAVYGVFADAMGAQAAASCMQEKFVGRFDRIDVTETVDARPQIQDDSIGRKRTG